MVALHVAPMTCWFLARLTYEASVASVALHDIQRLQTLLAGHMVTLQSALDNVRAA